MAEITSWMKSRAFINDTDCGKCHSEFVWSISSTCSLLSLQNKLKKIKEKYKDQDEEDRELMMQLLGVRMN